MAEHKTENGWTVTHIDKCANAACPNRVHSGQFTVIESPDALVGGHRPLRLHMCGPCATALRDALFPPVKEGANDRP